MKRAFLPSPWLRSGGASASHHLSPLNCFVFLSLIGKLPDAGNALKDAVSVCRRRAAPSSPPPVGPLACFMP